MPTLLFMEFLKDFFAFDKDERPLIKSALFTGRTYLIFTGYIALFALYIFSTGLNLSTEQLAAWVGAFLLLSLLTEVDVKHFILPDHITVPMILILYLASPLTSGLSSTESLWGLVIGGGAFALLAFTFFKVTGKHGMGGGDIKLMAALGAWVGVAGIPILMLFASLSSLVTIFIRKGLSKGELKDPLPFGPFLCTGAVLAILFKDIYWQMTQVVVGG